MNILMKRSLAFVIALVMCISFIPAFTVTIDATSSNSTVNYKYDGNYVYNWGTREAEATFLSPMAIAFYETFDVSYEVMSNYSGGTAQNNVPSSEMYKELQALMEDTLHSQPGGLLAEMPVTCPSSFFPPKRSKKDIFIVFLFW